MKGKRRNIVVHDKMWERLRRFSYEEQRSMSDLIREALNDLFKKRTLPASASYDPVKDKY